MSVLWLGNGEAWIRVEAAELGMGGSGADPCADLWWGLSMGVWGCGCGSLRLGVFELEYLATRIWVFTLLIAWVVCLGCLCLWLGLRFRSGAECGGGDGLAVLASGCWLFLIVALLPLHCCCQHHGSAV